MPKEAAFVLLGSMSENKAQLLVDDGTLEFTMGNTEGALELLGQALELDPDCYNAYLAKAEVYLSEKELQKALEAGEKAYALKPWRASKGLY